VASQLRQDAGAAGVPIVAGLPMPEFKSIGVTPTAPRASAR